MTNKSHVSVGKFSYGIKNSNVVWDMAAYTKNNIKFQPKLTVGNFVSVGLGTKFWLGGNHRHDWVTTFPFHVTSLHNTYKSFTNHIGNEFPGYPQSNGNIVVGNDVWIGENVTVLSGITIGDGAVIGTNSTIVKDVTPYSIVGGHPAKHIKYRFSKQDIIHLLDIKWWELSDDKIDKLLPFMYSNDIATFIKKAREL